MSTTTHSWGPRALFFVLFLALIVACGGPAQPPAVEGRPDTVSVPAAADGGAELRTTDAGASPAMPDAGGADAGGPGFFGVAKLCGCKLCEPKVSDDACTTDADCAPSSACHATSCIAASKVPPPTTRPICTRIMLCATTDANACACYQGKCALTPRR